MEERRDIEGYEGLYQVSNLGRIKSFKNGRRGIGKERILLNQNHRGYLRIILHRNGICEPNLIHRLVAKAFIPNSENKKEVNHKNGIRNDNRVDNLERCTPSENCLHKYRVLLNIPTYLGKFGKEHNTSKSVLQYNLQGNFIKERGSMADIRRELSINHISDACLGKCKTAGGYKWKFKF